jgi:hypothetical protein
MYRAVDGGWCCVINDSRTPGVPYGDAFAAQSLYCLTAPVETDATSSPRTRLRIFTGVKFSKNPFVKAMIRSSTLKGLSEYVADVTTCLWAEIRRLNPEAEEERVEPEVKDEEEEGEVMAKGGQRLLRFRQHMRWIYKKTIQLYNSLPRSALYALLLDIVLIFLLVILWKRSAGDQLRFRGGPLSTESLTALEAGGSTAGMPNRPLFSMPKHQTYYDQIEARRLEYHKARSQLHRTYETLVQRENRLRHAQYTIWLADQLSACYANPAASIDTCEQLDRKYLAELRRIL